MKYIISIIAGFVFIFNADAAITVKNHTAQGYANEAGVNYEDSAEIAILENDIAILDEEIAKCKKQKKGWVAATVVGSTGVLATGIAAIAQGSKIKDKKETLADKTDELKDKKQQNKMLQTTLDAMQQK